MCLPVGHDCKDAACRVLLVIANSQLAFTRVPGKHTVSCGGGNVRLLLRSMVSLEARFKKEGYCKARLLPKHQIVHLSVRIPACNQFPCMGDVVQMLYSESHAPQARAGIVEAWPGRDIMPGDNYLVYARATQAEPWEYRNQQESDSLVHPANKICLLSAFS